jgi:hypothetical protein
MCSSLSRWYVALLLLVCDVGHGDNYLFCLFRGGCYSSTAPIRVTSLTQRNKHAVSNKIPSRLLLVACTGVSCSACTPTTGIVISTMCPLINLLHLERPYMRLEFCGPWRLHQLASLSVVCTIDFLTTPDCGNTAGFFMSTRCSWVSDRVFFPAIVSMLMQLAALLFLAQEGTTILECLYVSYANPQGHNLRD